MSPDKISSNSSAELLYSLQAPSDFEDIAYLIASEDLAPDASIEEVEAQSPAAMKALETALSLYGITTTAPGPDVEAMIEALCPEDTISL